MKKNILFSPPDIGEQEIRAVSDVLSSAWITTGPKVAKFQEKISQFLGGGFSLCLNSATAGLELSLRIAGIRPNDEIITSPYTFAATSNVILHLGAKPIFADLEKNSFHLSAKTIEKKLSPRTRAILSVDYGGFPVDLPSIRELIQNTRQPIFLISDSAHSFGARIQNQSAASFADISVFSFHAVKNLTTAEGGALYIPKNSPFFSESFFKTLKQMSLHGMTRDAYEKESAGHWKYDIAVDGYKYNMSDIQAALGLVQLQRYPKFLEKRRKLFHHYTELFRDIPQVLLPPFSNSKGFEGSYHLFPIRIKGIKEQKRNKIIDLLKQKGIASNVHYQPLPLFSFYRKLGYQIESVPNAFEMYQNEISLPLHTLLEPNDQVFIKDQLIKIIQKEKI